jgi:transcriptional regulator with XRE-family HTH domain
VSTGDVRHVFGTRVRRERMARGWSLRELAAKCDVSFSTIHRAEIAATQSVHGRDEGIGLMSAMKIAEALSIPLAELLTVPDCMACYGTPPAGFTCNQCGRSAS